jgi:hypothetical protein
MPFAPEPTLVILGSQSSSRWVKKLIHSPGESPPNLNTKEGKALGPSINREGSLLLIPVPVTGRPVPTD